MTKKYFFEPVLEKITLSAMDVICSSTCPDYEEQETPIISADNSSGPACTDNSVN